MVKIYESCFSMSIEHGPPQVHVQKMHDKFNLWVVFFYETNAPTSYTGGVWIDLKGWLAYIVWRKHTVRDVMLQRTRICFMNIEHIAWDAWIRRKRNINDTERKDLNILENIMKSLRKTEKITGRHMVRLKWRVKFAYVQLENVDGQNMFNEETFKKYWGTGRITSMICLNKHHPRIYVLNIWMLKFGNIFW